MTGIKVFSVKTKKGNYAVEIFKDVCNSTRYRIMHDRRYVTAETFFTENQAIEALLEHLNRVFIRQLSLLDSGVNVNRE